MAKIKTSTLQLPRNQRQPVSKSSVKALAPMTPAQAPASPKTIGAPPERASALAAPFTTRRSDARPVAGKTPRPTDTPGE